MKLLFGSVDMPVLPEEEANLAIERMQKLIERAGQSERGASPMAFCIYLLDELDKRGQNPTICESAESIATIFLARERAMPAEKRQAMKKVTLELIKDEDNYVIAFAVAYIFGIFNYKLGKEVIPAVEKALSENPPSEIKHGLN